jgi:hypothetical protein
LIRNNTQILKYTLIRKNTGGRCHYLMPWMA